MNVSTKFTVKLTILRLLVFSDLYNLHKSKMGRKEKLSSAYIVLIYLFLPLIHSQVSSTFPVSESSPSNNGTSVISSESTHFMTLTTASFKDYSTATSTVTGQEQNGVLEESQQMTNKITTTTQQANDTPNNNELTETTTGFSNNIKTTTKKATKGNISVTQKTTSKTAENDTRVSQKTSSTKAETEERNEKPSTTELVSLVNSQESTSKIAETNEYISTLSNVNEEKISSINTQTDNYSNIQESRSTVETNEVDGTLTTSEGQKASSNGKTETQREDEKSGTTLASQVQSHDSTSKVSVKDNSRTSTILSNHDENKTSNFESRTENYSKIQESRSSMDMSIPGTSTASVRQKSQKTTGRMTEETGRKDEKSVPTKVSQVKSNDSTSKMNARDEHIPTTIPNVSREKTSSFESNTESYSKNQGQESTSETKDINIASSVTQKASNSKAQTERKNEKSDTTTASQVESNDSTSNTKVTDEYLVTTVSNANDENTSSFGLHPYTTNDDDENTFNSESRTEKNVQMQKSTMETNDISGTSETATDRITGSQFDMSTSTTGDSTALRKTDNPASEKQLTTVESFSVYTKQKPTENGNDIKMQSTPASSDSESQANDSSSSNSGLPRAFSSSHSQSQSDFASSVIAVSGPMASETTKKIPNGRNTSDNNENTQWEMKATTETGFNAHHSDSYSNRFPRNFGKWKGVDSKRGNLTCILLQGSIQLHIALNSTLQSLVHKNVKSRATLDVPSDAEAWADCGPNKNGSEVQLYLKWKAVSQNTKQLGHNVLRLVFQKLVTYGKMWRLTKYMYILKELQITFYAGEFLNESLINNQPGSVAEMEESHTMTNLNVFLTDVKRSFKCNARQNLSDPQNDNFGISFAQLKLEAFRETVDNDDEEFSPEFTCALEPDRVRSNTVAIAVGSSLLALIVVVLIMYLVGRRQWQRHGYEPL